MVKKILNELNDPKIRRASVIGRNIQRILCKNNPNGRVDPDTDDNDDKKVVVNPKRSVKLEEVQREMVNVMDLLENMKRVVENIDDFNAKNEFREMMADFELARQDIADEIQDRINDRIPAENRPPAINNAFLAVKGGGIDDLRSGHKKHRCCRNKHGIVKKTKIGWVNKKAKQGLVEKNQPAL